MGRGLHQSAPEGRHAFAAGQAGLPGDLAAAEPPHFVNQRLQPFVMPRNQMEAARHFGARPLNQFQVELVQARQIAVQLSARRPPRFRRDARRACCRVRK